MNELPVTDKGGVHLSEDDNHKPRETCSVPPWWPFLGLGLLVLVPLLLVLYANRDGASESTSEAFRTTAPAEQAVGTEPGAESMTVREFASAVERRSWKVAELYSRFGEPIRVFKPYTFHVYLWFDCRDGVAEVSCESTSFEMYGAITSARVERRH